MLVWIKRFMRQQHPQALSLRQAAKDYEGRSGISEQPLYKDIKPYFFLIGGSLFCLPCLLFRIWFIPSGRAVMSTRDKPYCCRISGNQCDKIQALAFTVSAALAGVAGVFMPIIFPCLRCLYLTIICRS